jgi:tetratricopeptide (TPR) repeat protein
MPKTDSRLVILLLAAALTAAAPPAFPEPANRDAALAALAGRDAAARAEAVVWLANRGGMADAPLLHERLRDESGLVRSYAEQGLWLLWLRSGDADIDALMARGIEQMQGGDLTRAITTFSEIIRKKPEFAEGWNKRATAYFLAGEHQKSIADCGEVLERNPGHFGALSGMGQIHLKLENYAEALKWFRRALEVNPNMVGVEINIRSIEDLLKQRRDRST